MNVKGQTDYRDPPEWNGQTLSVSSVDLAGSLHYWLERVREGARVEILDEAGEPIAVLVPQDDKRILDLIIKEPDPAQ